MNWTWQELNIEATRDPAAIRKAYATHLKQIDMENDAEGFQRLRSAFERALELANLPEDAYAELSEEYFEPSEAQWWIDGRFPSAPPDAPAAQDETAHRHEERVAAEIASIYTEYRVNGGAAALNRTRAALAVLQNETIDGTLMFEREMIRRLYEASTLPMEVVGYLIERFEWTERAASNHTDSERIAEIVHRYNFWLEREKRAREPSRPAPSRDSSQPESSSGNIWAYLLLIPLLLTGARMCFDTMRSRPSKWGPENPLQRPVPKAPSGDFRDFMKEHPKP